MQFHEQAGAPPLIQQITHCKLVADNRLTHCQIEVWIAFSLTISVPQSNQKFFRGFKKGLRDFSQDYCIGLIGGDLVKGQLQISVTVYGVPEKNILLRSGARLGDLVYLSGP